MVELIFRGLERYPEAIEFIEGQLAKSPKTLSY